VRHGYCLGRQPICEARRSETRMSARHQALIVHVHDRRGQVASIGQPGTILEIALPKKPVDLM
jgi:hypothetical protein